MTVRSLPVPDGLAGERVDTGLARLLGVSRTRAADLATAGAVRLDGGVVGKSDRLAPGAWLEVDVTALDGPATPASPPEPVPGMHVVHEDPDLLVVDKPVGVAAHPSPGWTGPTVVGALAAAGYTVATAGAAERQGIVHRLDVGTSGLMVVAKSDRAYSALKRAFKERTVEKVYHAVVQGHPEPTVGTVDAPIGRHPKADHKFAVTAGGKPSVTHYEVLEMVPTASMVEVHLSALRHPCVGDLTYGADPVLAERLGLRRQWLHAVRLAFAHPATGRPFEVTTQYPEDLRVAWDRLHGPS